MDGELSTEQQYMLQRLAMEAKGMSREQLIEALCDSWEARYRQRQCFISSSRSAGFVFQMEERRPWQQPETEEEFKEILGYVPTEEEANAYLKDAWETATMELDMDEIVLMSDEEFDS